MSDLDPYYAPTCLCPHPCGVHPKQTKLPLTIEETTTYIYEPVEFGYYQSTFKLIRVEGFQPMFPKVGEIDTMNTMLNVVANGCRLIIEPKGK